MPAMVVVGMWHALYALPVHASYAVACIICPPGLPPVSPSAKTPGSGEPSRLSLRCFALVLSTAKLPIQL